MQGISREIHATSPRDITQNFTGRDFTGRDITQDNFNTRNIVACTFTQSCPEPPQTNPQYYRGWYAFSGCKAACSER
jgi:hypothetical protein